VLAAAGTYLQPLYNRLSVSTVLTQQPDLCSSGKQQFATFQQSWLFSAIFFMECNYFMDLFHSSYHLWWYDVNSCSIFYKNFFCLFVHLSVTLISHTKCFAPYHRMISPVSRGHIFAILNLGVHHKRVC